MLKNLGDIKPQIHRDAFVAETASVIGDVKIGEGSSVWYGAVIRGDIEDIVVGKYSNIQDNASVHTETDIPTRIGDYTVVGHNAIIHGCTLGDNAVIGDNCIIGAGTVVTEGKKIPDNSMVIGIPGKVVREVTEEEKRAIRDNAVRYNSLYKRHIE
jgi:carbonic anhydrase/acetyltransferase-like protein (isoleucine patch superfamily)